MERFALAGRYSLMVAIVAPIVDGPERLPADDQGMVLDKAVDTLSRTIYQGSLRDAITYLHKLAGYHLEADEYARIREKAQKSLVDIAVLQPDNPYVMQLTLLEKIPVWLEQDFGGNLDLSLAIIRPMLSMQSMSTGTDPTESFSVYFQRRVLRPDESLRRIRKQALDILYQVYRSTSSLPERLRVIQSLGGAAPHIAPSFQVSPETYAWLQPDCLKTAHFFSEEVVPQAELPVLDAVAKWLWRARRFGGYQGDVLEHLRQQIQGHSSYQLYRVLVGWHRPDDDDDQSTFRAAEQRRAQAVEHYIDGLSPAAMGEAIHALDTIVEQAHSTGESGKDYLNVFLRKLGEEQPYLARQLIERTVDAGLTLKDHLGFVIAGLRRGAPDMAWTYIESWMVSNDHTLWHAGASSYHFVDWSNLQPHEWDVLRRLTAKSSASVDAEIIGLSRRFSPQNPDLAIEVLKIAATRGDDSILGSVWIALGGWIRCRL
jgi:hypothetical protein